MAACKAMERLWPSHSIVASGWSTITRWLVTPMAIFSHWFYCYFLDGLPIIIVYYRSVSSYSGLLSHLSSENPLPAEA